MTDTLYKIVRIQGGAAHPCHGGSPDFTWPLPNGEPGAWVEHTGRIALCESGLHLTRRPIEWYLNDPDVRLFEAEYEGELLDGGEKVCARKARLVREVDWAVAGILTSGIHALSGNTQASLYGNARATLSDNAQATLFGNARATLYSNARATLYENARATATGESVVVSTRWHADTAAVALSQMAAHIDRRQGKLAYRDGLGREVLPA